ncbi:MAG TPA: zinc ribbon domain-containing protein [Patescibacteria group bacterium]|nr:zinc ribbon domain-containing protein [Patescibacteria group bacterium]
MMTWGMLIAILAGIWVFFDAKKRGSAPNVAGMWALGTVALLIVFLPLYLLFGRKPAVKPYRRGDIIDVEAIPVEEIIYCTMCGGKAKEDFVVCPHCGHTLKPQCTSCGKTLDRTWRVCPFCQEPAGHK